MKLWALAVVMIGVAGLALAQTQPTQPRVAPRPKVPEGVKAMYDIPYVENGSKAQTLDLYVPEKGEGPFPVVVWVHGGAWRRGSKNECPAVPLVEKGYVLASVGYRLSQEAVFPAQIHDCKAAVRFLRANAKQYNLDPARFGAWGASAGGHLVSLLGTTGGVKEMEGTLGNAEQSSKVQCVVNWFGPADFTTIVKQSGPEIKMNHASPTSPEAQLIGETLSETSQKAKAASPAHYITKEAPPILIMHGDKDATIPLAQSKEFHAALKKAGVDSTLDVIEGAGHGFPQQEQMTRVAEFLDAKLKGK